MFYAYCGRAVRLLRPTLMMQRDGTGAEYVGEVERFKLEIN